MLKIKMFRLESCKYWFYVTIPELYKGSTVSIFVIDDLVTFFSVYFYIVYEIRKLKSSYWQFLSFIWMVTASGNSDFRVWFKSIHTHKIVVVAPCIVLKNPMFTYKTEKDEPSLNLQSAPIWPAENWQWFWTTMWLVS